MPKVSVVFALSVAGLGLIGCAESRAQEEVSVEPGPAVAGQAKVSPERLPVRWEVIHTEEDNYGLTRVERTAVPGGWLVRSLHRQSTSKEKCPMGGSGHACGLASGVGLGESMTFVPDPGHTWNATP